LGKKKRKRKRQNEKNEKEKEQKEKKRRGGLCGEEDDEEEDERTTTTAARPRSFVRMPLRTRLCVFLQERIIFTRLLLSLLHVAGGIKRDFA
jgi:hypothetical protein